MTTVKEACYKANVSYTAVLQKRYLHKGISLEEAIDEVRRGISHTSKRIDGLTCLEYARLHGINRTTAYYYWKKRKRRKK